MRTHDHGVSLPSNHYVLEHMPASIRAGTGYMPIDEPSNGRARLIANAVRCALAGHFIGEQQAGHSFDAVADTNGMS